MFQNYENGEGYTMSNIESYMQKRFLLEQMQKEIEQLENDEQLQKDLKFKEDFDKLLAQYEKSKDEAFRILSPQPGKDSPQSPPRKGKRNYHRRTKVYTNPHTGEKLETRGGNNKQLVQWRNEYGTETVEGWVEIKD